MNDALSIGTVAREISGGIGRMSASVGAQTAPPAGPFDAAGLADAVLTVLHDDGMWAATSAKSRRTAEAEYPLGIQAERCRGLYRRLAGQPAGTGGLSPTPSVMRDSADV